MLNLDLVRSKWPMKHSFRAFGPWYWTTFWGIGP